MSAGPPRLEDIASRQGMQVKNGGITLAQGGWIKAGQTGYNVGTGFFLGYSGTTYKFSVGNPAGNCLTWDGSTLTVKGTISLGSSVPWGTVSGTGKPSDNADVTLSAVNGGLSVTGGGITLSGGGSIKGGQTAYDSGTGFFLGYSGAAYKFSIGNSAGSKLTWDGSSLGIVGNISGSSNLDIAGTAHFTGSYSDGTTVATVYAHTLTAGVHAVYGSAGSGAGVLGLSLTGDGVAGYSFSTTAAGGYFTNESSGPALTVVGPQQNTGDVTITGIITGGVYTVATLPAAAGVAGGRAAVTDALGPVFTAVVVGGGAVPCPVYSDGVTWRCG